MINRVGFVLIKPQLPENIGFCARALKNFGFKKLDLVDPKEKWPNRKAIATSVGANNILKKTKIYFDIKSAINSYDIVYASSARKRDINKKHLSFKQFIESIKKNKINSFAKAHILVDGKEIVCEGSGNGPVNALDNAIRSNVDKVGKYSKYLKDLKLLDYKVRILNTGTNATTRVSIESTDREGKSWYTIGVSPNIIEASFKALIDSLDYKLYKEKAPANN